MAIEVFEGTPGSGKTYDAVKKISDNLRLGRTIYTNIDGMDDPDCKKVLKSISGLDDYQFATKFHILTKEQCYHFWDDDICEKGSLIVIDEAHKWFNSRNWKSKENQAFSDWCSTHRHYGFDVILITQRIEKIDSQARSCVEWTSRYKKINFLGNLMNGIAKSYVVYLYSGDDTSDCMSKSVRRYDSRIFRCYQSYAASDIKERDIQKHTNIFKHPVFISIPLSIVFCIFMIVKSSNSHNGIFSYKSFAKNIENARATTTSVLPPEPDISGHKLTKAGSPQGKPASGAFAPAPAAATASANIKPPIPLPDSNNIPPPIPASKRLLAIIDGKKIYKCGDIICE